MNKKNIIIIGATSGIGRALFEKYAAEGNRIDIVALEQLYETMEGSARYIEYCLYRLFGNFNLSETK